MNLRHLLLSSLLLAVVTAPPVAAVETLYVAGSRPLGEHWDEVLVLDPIGGGLLGTIAVEPSPVILSASPDRVFVGHFPGSNHEAAVTAIHPGSQSVLWQTTLGNALPVSLHVVRPLDVLLVSISQPGRVVSLDLTRGTFLKQLDFARFSAPSAIGPDNDFLFAIGNDLIESRLIKMDTESLTIEDELLMTAETGGSVAVDPLTGLIYLEESDTGNLSVVDPESFSRIGTVATRPNPFGLQVNAPSRSLYIKHGDPIGLSRIDLSSWSEAAFSPLSSTPALIAFSAERDEIFVSLPNAREVLVLDMLTLESRRSFPLTILPVGVAIHRVLPLSVPSLSGTSQGALAVLLGLAGCAFLLRNRLAA